MEVPINAPREIKKAIAKRLQKNGALKVIERRIKLGMLVAVEEIREDPKAAGNLERKKFKNASPHELKALQAIYRFLDERNMTYTLSCLLEDSAIRRNPKDRTDITEMIDVDEQPVSTSKRVATDLLDSDDDMIDDLVASDDSGQDIVHKSKGRPAGRIVTTRRRVGARAYNGDDDDL